MAASGPFSFPLQDLPNRALELIAQLASTPSTPATCLLPLVCRGWRDAADRAQLLVDIRLDLTPAYLCLFDSDQWKLQLSMLHAGEAAAAAVVAVAAAASPAAAVPAIPSGLLKARRLAAWLAGNSSRLRSLCLSGTDSARSGELGPAWGPHLRSICAALAAGQGAGASPPLPHLVQLELPIMDLCGIEASLEALSRGCPALQRLALKGAVVGGYHEGLTDVQRYNMESFQLYMLEYKPIGVDLIARAVAPLTCLRVLHVRGDIMFVQGGSMAGLLRALPATLEELDLAVAGCMANISLSCITHLVNLRCWEQPLLGMVLHDSSSSSSSSSSGAAALTALTRLQTNDILYKLDARLQLPGLCVLQSQFIESAAWQQLQGMKHLRHLSAGVWDVQHGGGNGGGPPSQGDQGAAGLAGMTQLQQLELGSISRFGSRQLSMAQPWAAAVAKLTGLTALQLSANVMLAGVSTLLAPLTQLRALTVKCTQRLSQGHYPDGAEGWAATPAGAVVQAMAAAVQGSLGHWQLQRLVLVVPFGCTWSAEHAGGAQQVQLVASAVLPQLLVEVQQVQKELVIDDERPIMPML